MQLTKNHRASLLNTLEAAQKELDTNQHCLNKQDKQDDKDYFEIKVFIAQQIIDLIKKSLVDNEIDY